MLYSFRLFFPPSFLWIYEAQEKTFQIRGLHNKSSSRILLKEEKGMSEITSVLMYHE